MTSNSTHPQIDEQAVFGLIGCIRSDSNSSAEVSTAQTELCESLKQVAKWYAVPKWDLAGYDSDQVVNDSLNLFLQVYVQAPEFAFQSDGHIVGIIRQITLNQRKKAYRWLNQAKRSAHAPDGRSLSTDSLDPYHCLCNTRVEDPAFTCEYLDEVEHCLNFLALNHHKEVFQYLIDGLTWPEIADELNVDIKVVRKWIGQVRRVLTPHTSHLTPHTLPNTKHQAPSTKHQASRGPRPTL